MPDYGEVDDRGNWNTFSGLPWNGKKTQIKIIIIKEGVTNIGSSAFYGCTNLTSVTIPNSVTSIGDHAFHGCTNLTSVTIPNSVTSIGSSAFYRTKWYDNQPDGVVYAGKVLYAYKGTMPSNTKIDIKEGTTEIAGSAFSRCSGLTSVTIPNTVTSIGYSAFYGCSSIASLTIPNSVTSIGHHAFDGCSGLTSLTIPNSVTSIGRCAFYGTKWYYNQPDGLIYAGKVLYAYKGTMPSNTKIDIKEGTTEIGNSAFFGYANLTSVTIPNSVTSIGGDAFYDCVGLKKIFNSSSLSISKGAWDYGQIARYADVVYNNVSVEGDFRICKDAKDNSYICEYLGSDNNITLPKNVYGIADFAFSGCSGFTSVTIGNSVTSIGEKAFYGCSDVKEIYSWNVVPPACCSATFGEMNTLHAKLFVPEGSGDAYKYAPYWREFLNIYEMEYTPVLSAADPITISDSKPSVTKGYYKEKTVTYVREGAAISKENYASFCLPFAVDPADAQFKAVYVPVGLSLYDTEANTLRIGFYQTNDIIPAGTPFLAQLAVDDKVEIKNALPVNYAPNAPAVKTSVVRTFNHSNSAGIMNENNDFAISFSGSYNKVSPANGYTFNTDGSIGASANVVPFRAYFVIGKNASNAKILTSFDIDAETTGIDQLRMTNNELPVYDMNGRRVNEKSLKSGIYIKNGKKYVK